MDRKVIMGAALLACAALPLSLAQAHEGAEGVVKQRMDLMRSLGDSMKTLVAMMRGKQEYDADAVRSLAGRIAMHGGDAMTDLFPDDSIEGPSEALPDIWEDWDAFAAQADLLETRAEALAQNAGTRSDAMPAFGGLARACSACHRDYRATKR